MKNAPSPTQRVGDVFGWREFPHALFYQTDFSLRFDLGADLPTAPVRFLQAIDRARQVTDLLFGKSEQLTALAGYYDGERRTSRASASFKALKEMGFDTSFGPAEQVRQNDTRHIAEFGEDLCRYRHAADFDRNPRLIEALLWASIAREMPVTPKARHLERLYIIDFRRGIAACAYDDRGMDVIGISRTPLQPLYEQFGNWLLDDDRARMDNIFAPHL